MKEYKPVLYIGANSDVAKSSAEFYAKKGHTIILIARNINRIEAFRDHIEETYKVKCTLYELDILDFNSFDLFFEALNIKIEILICCVGLMKDNEFNLSVNDKNLIINTNYVGPSLFIDSSIRYFQKNYIKGTIIGISSVAGGRGRSKNYLYGAAKSAFSEYLSGVRQKFSNAGIHIITIKPGFINTKMLTNKKVSRLLVSSPYEIAKLIYNAYKAKKYVVYPFRWKIIMSIVVIIPEYIFKKLNF